MGKIYTVNCVFVLMRIYVDLILHDPVFYTREKIIHFRFRERWVYSVIINVKEGIYEGNERVRFTLGREGTYMTKEFQKGVRYKFIRTFI